jgi:hypothetical protein
MLVSLRLALRLAVTARCGFERYPIMALTMSGCCRGCPPTGTGKLELEERNLRLMMELLVQCWHPSPVPKISDPGHSVANGTTRTRPFPFNTGSQLAPALGISHPVGLWTSE